MRIAYLASGLLALAAALGCSGALQTDEGNRQPYMVALMVSDLEGSALGDAAVWIDNQLMTEKTAASFTPMGSGFPSEWQGWPTNYVSPTLYTIIDFPEDVDRVEIIVAKSGYHVTRVAFDLGDVAGTFFFRAAVPLEPAP